METVSISQFKATCLEVLRRVQLTGEPVLVTKRGEAIAEIRPAPEPSQPKSWLGSMKGTVEIHGDIVSPVAEEDWEVLQSE
jgi:prevent-host-death family protein